MSAFVLLLAACGPTEVPLGAPLDSSSAPTGDADRAPADDTDPPDAIVDCDGSGDFTTITAAIAAAASGDVIRVQPCDYAENIDLVGKTLRIVSSGGPTVTSVTGRSGLPVVQAISGEGTGSSVEGFTLTGGGGSSNPAVSVDLSSLRLADDILDDNRGTYVVYGASAEIELSEVTITNNRASYDVEVYVHRGSLVASDLSLDCNGATYGIYTAHGAALVDRAAMSCRGGYTTTWNHSVGRVQRSTLDGGVYIEAEVDHYDDTLFLENDVISGGVFSTYGTLDVRNSIVAGGISLTTAYAATTIEASVIHDATCAINADSADFIARNNVFWNDTANACGTFLDPVGTNDNQAADPLFTDATHGDYTLQPGSPAIDAGPDEAGYPDVDGSRNDIGAYGGPLSIGGGW